MNIDSISQGSSLYAKNERINRKKEDDKSSSESRVSPKADKLELSGEAQRFARIQSRINSGYYDQPEVMRQVAEKLNNDI
jgi:hypothetical protein